MISRLTQRGARVAAGSTAGSFAVEITDEQAPTWVVEIVAELGVGLVRLQRRRHHLAEIFASDASARGVQS